MQGSVVIPMRNLVESSYEIRVASVVEMKYEEEQRPATDQEVIHALAEHFDWSIDFLQKRKKEIFG